MLFIGVEVEQETSAPPPKKILDPPLPTMLSSAARKATKFENWNDLGKETENASLGCKSVSGAAH